MSEYTGGYIMNYEISDQQLDNFISEVIDQLPKTVTNKEFKRIYEEQFTPIMEIKYGVPKSQVKKTIFWINNTRDLYYIMKTHGIEIIDTPQEKINYKEKGFRRLKEIEENANCIGIKEVS